jgi:hypothetical protein
VRRLTLCFAAALFAALAAAAQTTSPFPQAVGIQTRPAVASAGGASLVIWTDPRNGQTTRIFGSPLDASAKLTVPDGVLAGRDVRLLLSESTLALLPLGPRFVAVWTDSAVAVRARRLEADGTPVDRDPVSLVSSGAGIQAVGAASNGTSIALLTIDGVYVFDSSLQFGAFIPLQQLTILPFSASMASDGTDFVIAGRDGTNRLVAARFTAAGSVKGVTVIDPTPVAADVGRLVWTGTDYAAVMRSQTIRAYRLDANGARTAGPFDVVTLSSTFVDLDAASDGSGGFVVIYNERANLFVAYVSGVAVAQTQPVAVSLASQSKPSVSFDGAHYVAAWEVLQNGAGGIDAAAFSLAEPRTEPVSSEQTRAPAAQRRPAAAKWQAALVAWEEEDGSGVPRIMIRASGSNPAVLSPSALPQLAPKIDESTAGGALVAWVERGGTLTLMAARVDSAGNRTGAPFAIATAGSAEDHAVLHIDGQYLVAFTDPAGRMRVARVTDGGSLLDPDGRVVLPRVLPQSEAHPVFTVIHGTIFLIWKGNSPCDPPVCPAADYIGGVRLDRDGNSLDPASLFVGLGIRPEAASDGERMLVVWQRDTSVYGRVLSLDGQTDPFYIAQAGSSPSVTFDGAAFLATWQQVPVADQLFAFDDILAARVGQDGSVQTLTVDQQHDALAPLAFTALGVHPTIVWPRLDDDVPRLFFEQFEGHVPPARRRSARK